MLTVIETNENQHAYMTFHPEPIGQIEVIDGVKMRVVDNTNTYIVTYEEVKEEA